MGQFLLIVAVQVSRRGHESRLGPAAHQHPVFLLCCNSFHGGASLGWHGSPDMRSATAIITSIRVSSSSSITT